MRNRQMQSSPFEDRQKQIFDSDSQSNEDEENKKGRKINGKKNQGKSSHKIIENRFSKSQNIPQNVFKLNQNKQSKSALSQSGTQKKKSSSVQANINKNIQEDQNSDDYDPQNSQQDFQNSYSDDQDENENEDQNDSDEESDEVHIYKSKKPPQLSKKISLSSAMKKEASVEKKPEEINKKRRKKRKRRVILKTILGELNNIDSVDPFLKNLWSTVSQTKNASNKIQTILLKNVDKQKFIYESEGQKRKTPMLKDFVSFCAQSALKSCYLDGKIVIKHFNIPINQNTEQEISLIQSIIQPFLNPNLKKINNEEQLQQALYDIRLLQQISNLKQVEQFDNPEKEYRKESLKKTEALKQILKRGYLKIMFQKAQIDFQKSKKSRKQKMHNMKFEQINPVREILQMGEYEMKVQQKNEEMFYEESLMKENFEKEKQSEWQIFQEQGQN